MRQCMSLCLTWLKMYLKITIAKPFPVHGKRETDEGKEELERHILGAQRVQPPR